MFETDGKKNGAITLEKLAELSGLLILTVNRVLKIRRMLYRRSGSLC